MLPWSVMPRAGWPSAAAAADDLADPGGAVEHRVLGVDVEVGEAVSHPGRLLARRITRLWFTRTVRPADGTSEVGAGTRARRRARRAGPGPPAGSWPLHLLELLAGGHLLGEQGGLDAVEQALEPADQLGLGDAQLGPGRGVRRSNGWARRASSSRRSGDSADGQLGDRGLVDLPEALPAGLVELGAAAPPRGAA